MFPCFKEGHRSMQRSPAMTTAWASLVVLYVTTLISFTGCTPSQTDQPCALTKPGDIERLESDATENTPDHGGGNPNAISIRQNAVLADVTRQFLNAIRPRVTEDELIAPLKAELERRRSIIRDNWGEIELGATESAKLNTAGKPRLLGYRQINTLEGQYVNLLRIELGITYVEPPKNAISTKELAYIWGFNTEARSYLLEEFGQAAFDELRVRALHESKAPGAFGNNFFVPWLFFGPGKGVGSRFENNRR